MALEDLCSQRSFAFGEVALDGGNGLLRAQVNVGGLPSHAVGEPLFVAFFGQGMDFDVAAIGSQAADNPVLGKMHVRIADAHGRLNQSCG